MRIYNEVLKYDVFFEIKKKREGKRITELGLDKKERDIVINYNVPFFFNLFKNRN